ncbi:MAG: DUF4340 domain-containing protein [Thermodesulfobacteriota bacterium]
MKLKTFAILLIICCILLAAVLLTTRQKKTTETAANMGAKLFTGLSAGDIAAITISGPEGAARLKRTPNGWIVENRFDYPADFSKVAELVKKLSDAKVGRTFPASPEIQARLSLFPPEKPELPADQKGTLVLLTDKDNKTQAELIIGKPREESAGAGDGTCYVLRPSQNRVYLIDQNFRFLETKPAGWLNKKPIDLNPKRIQKVVGFDTRRNRLFYILERPAQDREPVLTDLPAGRKMAKFKADQVFEALASFTVEDVADHGRQSADARFSGAPRFEYHLYDGTVYSVFPGAALKDDPDKHYFRAAVSFQFPPGKVDPAQEESRAKLAEEAQKLNEKISPWTFVISKWVYESFITDPKTFIEKAEKK